MEKESYGFIIIGAGPAGLAAAQYSARANIDTLLIDESVPGGQVLLTLKIIPEFFRR